MAKAKKSNDTGKSAASKKPTAAASGDEKKSPAKGKAGAGATAKAPAAKSASPKAKVERGAGRGAGAGGGALASPMIDTNLAAQAAAKMLTAGLPSKNTATGAGAASPGGTSSSGKPQSAMFKQLKEGLSKPHLSGMDSVLDKGGAPGSKRPNLPSGNERMGHNQTFGADVNRAGVPRRTPG